LGVPEAERVQLPEGFFYDWEFEGCSVVDLDGKQVGKVSEVMRLGGEIETLAVVNAVGKTIVIPMVEEIVKEVDLVGREIRIDPPEGLLEL
jgi:16S rRNA processing protein RimM